jgi:hypothetical protein
MSRPRAAIAMSGFTQLVPPPGIDRMRELTHRYRYDRERACAVEHDEAEGVSWPVDLGEAGA